MAIPTFDEFIYPLLCELQQEPEGLRSRDAYKKLAERMDLDEKARSRALPSGRQLVFHNRICWAHDRLKRAGLSESARRGIWRITDHGIAFMRDHPRGIDEKTLRELATAKANTAFTTAEAPRTSAQENEHADRSSPQERIEEALEELRESVAQDLLRNLYDGSPDFFEIVVLDLLHAMGYGTHRRDAQHVGRSGDGGIDGVIALDRLGLQKVYVQAKRWSADRTISRPEIQGFFGALAGRRATYGVFITTSKFTREAMEYASTVSDSIVLVDGGHLAQLMIDHQIGVSHQQLRIPAVDGDYFQEE